MNALRRLESGRITTGKHAIGLRLDVRVDATTNHTFWSGLTTGTIGGLFLATHHALPIGTPLNVRLVIGDGRSEAIELMAEVRRAIPYNEGEVEPGLVIAFRQLSPEAASRVRRFVANVRAPLFLED
jgi:hypothetical protein